MKKSAAMLALLATAFVACKKDKTPKDEFGNFDITGTWENSIDYIKFNKDSTFELTIGRDVIEHGKYTTVGAFKYNLSFDLALSRQISSGFATPDTINFKWLTGNSVRIKYNTDSIVYTRRKN